MDLKNAVAVCLISLFSATLVLLIARALDLQSASRTEPQLVKIAEELQAIRRQGGLTAAPGAAAGSRAMDDGLMVYYFHGNTRCPTCRSIESQSHDAVHAGFAAELESGRMAWKILNYEEPAGAGLGKKFEVQVPVVVLARMSGGQIRDWVRLDKVWALVGDKPAFAEYIRAETNRLLATADAPPSAAPTGDTADTAAIPIPETDPERPPLPTVPSDLPVPDDLPVSDDLPVPDDPSVPGGSPLPEDKPAVDTVPVPDDLPVPAP